MHPLFEQALGQLDDAFRKMARHVPPPVLVPFTDGFVFRFKEKTIQQALIQKLARIISGLRGAAVLLDQGLVQEQGVIQRTLDELGEDVAFLAVAITNDTITPLHQRYLDSFYEEEFDPKTGKELNRRKRDMVPRGKITAYITRLLGGAHINPSKVIDNAHHVSKVYSGFVHAASPHIMDMFGGSPPHFHINGMLGTPRAAQYQDDLWNYFYRALNHATIVAKAFGDAELVRTLQAYIDHFEACSGTTTRRDTLKELGKQAEAKASKNPKQS
jgi:hypothetical protein